MPVLPCPCQESGTKPELGFIVRVSLQARGSHGPCDGKGQGSGSQQGIVGFCCLLRCTLTWWGLCPPRSWGVPGHGKLPDAICAPCGAVALAFTCGITAALAGMTRVSTALLLCSTPPWVGPCCLSPARIAAGAPESPQCGICLGSRLQRVCLQGEALLQVYVQP